MHFLEAGTFEVLHKHLAWPWIAIDVTRTRFAFASTSNELATRVFADGKLAYGPTFELPVDIELPTARAPETGHGGTEAGIHGFAIAKTGTLVAVTATVGGASVVLTVGEEGERKRSRLDALAGAGFVAHAVAFDRTGTRLWISAESGTETALILIEAESHAVLGVVRSAAFPSPATHELHMHPEDDAVLLLATCGEDGVFARVAGWSDGPPVAVPGALDAGGISAGFVGFSADGARVHFAEVDELRTHSWPDLVELTSVELADDFVSSYSGVVLGDRILVDGNDAETTDDSVMVFDRSALVGRILPPPVPTGMWVGRLGDDAIVTVESKGDPSRGRVVRLPAPTN